MVSSDQLKFLLLTQRLHNIHVDPDEEKKSPALLLVMFGPRSPRQEAHLSFLDFTIFLKFFFFIQYFPNYFKSHRWGL